MRRDIAPADAPYSTDDLVRDFERVALYDEYIDVDGRYVHSEAAGALRRWDQPVRVAVMTGGSARPRTRPATAPTSRPSPTGCRSSPASTWGWAPGADVNFLVLFMTSEERTAFADQVSTHYPNFAPAVVSALRDTPLDTFCTAYAFSRPTIPRPTRR